MTVANQQKPDQQKRTFRVYLLSGLVDIGLAAVIGFVGLDFVEGEPTARTLHMIGAGLFVVMGVATIWYGRHCASKAGGDAGSVFRVEG